LSKFCWKELDETRLRYAVQDIMDKLAKKMHHKLIQIGIKIVQKAACTIQESVVVRLCQTAAERVFGRKK